MAAPQPIEHQQRSYEVFEKKHDMECTTQSHGAARPGRVARAAALRADVSPRPACGARAWDTDLPAGHQRPALAQGDCQRATRWPRAIAATGAWVCGAT